MIIIADSGSTKTDWCLVRVERGVSIVEGRESIVERRVQTEGINPVHMDKDLIIKSLAPIQKMIVMKDNLSSCQFYGAGCTSEHSGYMQQLLSSALQIPFDNVHVHSDMLGAARAVCSREAGIACILGTGSNSCYYDGTDIIDNIPPLGYILGDEGSGASLGKIFLNALFKRDLPESLRRLFLEESQTTYQEIIERVYRKPLANRYLASLSTFIGAHIKEYPELETIVIDNFRTFFRKNVSKYQHPELPVGAVGSIAYHYQSQLRAAAAIEGYRVGNIIKSPIEGLVNNELYED